MFYEKIKKILIVSFLFIVTACCLCILISMIIVLIPHISINDWDFLAFVGSIIGGLITWLGVKKTLGEQRKERFLDKYQREMREIHSLVNDTRYIINVHLFEIYHEEEEKPDLNGTLQMHADSLNDFIKEINTRLPELISSVEWRVVHKLDLRAKFLSGFLAYYRKFDIYLENEGYARMREVVDKYLDKALEIHTELDDYREELMRKYYDATSKS